MTEDIVSSTYPEAKILSSYYQEQHDRAWAELRVRKEQLLDKLETAKTPQERRAIGEQLAALPTSVRLM
jgi:hypothetical protein